MNVQKIGQYTNFRSNEQLVTEKTKQKPEFIDKLMGKIKNPSDITDCVAVPRGIFKAYMFIMGGSALLGISAVLPQKLKYTKMVLSIAGTILNFISAIFFAKGFALKGLSPTVNPKDYNRQV